MLDDRDYMRHREAPFRQRPPRQTGMPSFLLLLIIANAIMFLVADKAMVGRLALISARWGTVEGVPQLVGGVRGGEWYRLVSSMFLHGGWFHLGFNMWGLYLFGSLLEKRLGSHRFIMLYFISGLVGAGCWLATNWDSSVPCIGASGALFGVIIGAAMLFPDIQIMLLFPPIPMKLRTFAIVYALLEIFMEFSGTQGGIAHIVHLGGILGGYLYLRVSCGRELAWDPLGFIRRRRGPGDVRGQNQGLSFHRPEVPQDELDRILDKISTAGVNALSEAEMETLRRAREAMRGGR